MGRNIDDIIKKLPPARQKRIQDGAERMAREMIRHADSLEQLRKAVGKTQVEVAETLGIKQNAISQLEKRTDLYVSTLNKYVRALGHTLELSLVMRTGERIALPNLHPWDRPEGVAGASPGGRRPGAKPVSGRATAAKKKSTGRKAPVRGGA